jgi:hypothetical protein
LAKNRIDDIISFSTNGVNNVPGIIDIGEKAEKVDSYNTINNTISKINIFFF